MTQVDVSHVVEVQPARPQIDIRRLPWRRGLGTSLILAVVATLAFIFLLPMIWMVATSLKPESQVWEFPPRFIPREWLWRNYPEAASQFPFAVSLRNTFWIMLWVMVGRLVTGSLVAFSFARLRFPGRNFLFMLLLSTMMIPYYAVLIPQFILFRELGWIDSFKPLIVPSLFGSSAFYIFLLRQFYRTIPTEMDDAARIDGCSTFGIWWRIIVPISTPALATVAIFTFMGEWNDFFGPLIYLNTPDKHTVAIAVQQWERTADSMGFQHNWNHIMAISTLVTLPPLLVFFFAQRFFIQGIVISGVKG